MKYQTFQPHPDLESFIKCYWILEVPADIKSEKQRIIPDGCIEMIFSLGDNIKRYTAGDEFIIQPRAMILGQTIDPFFIEPTGYVNTFAVRFYPYGFTSFAGVSINQLANTETPIDALFGQKLARDLEDKIAQATDTNTRIAIIEDFLLEKLKEKSTIDSIVKETVDTMFQTNGSASIGVIVKNDLSKRRQLERKFLKQVGVSPKKLGKVIRLQTALKLILAKQNENLTKIAYESDYFDQSHFVKDFKEFTGTHPGGFFKDGKLVLSALIYGVD